MGCEQLFLLITKSGSCRLRIAMLTYSNLQRKDQVVSTKNTITTIRNTVFWNEICVFICRNMMRLENGKRIIYINNSFYEILRIKFTVHNFELIRGLKNRRCSTNIQLDEFTRERERFTGCFVFQYFQFISFKH